MNPSDSPTQSNAGRSYDHYFINSGIHGDGLEYPESGDEADRNPSLAVSHDLRTLKDGDTGAVNFDSPIRDHESVLDVGAGSPDLSQPDSVPPPFGGFPPETPAPETKNPFGQQRKASQILPPSQLFARTQSVRKRHFSPTSSRPSPNVFLGNDISPNPAASSPLKARGLISSPLPDSTSSPAPLPALTSPQIPMEEMTPLNAGTLTSLISELASHGMALVTEGPSALSEYEPMGLSQERRSGAVIHQDSVHSDVDDDEEDVYDRRQRAKLKRAAAQNKLEDINVPYSSRSSRVEVPSTNKKARARSQAEEYLDQCHRKTDDGDSDAGETVADSQQHVIENQRPESQTAVSTQSNDDQESIPSTAPLLEETGHLGISQDLADDAHNDPYQEAIPETSPTARQRRESLHVEGPSLSAPIIPATIAGSPDYQSSPPGFSTRTRRRAKENIDMPETASPSTPAPISSMSSLSSLAAETPTLTSSTTPATKASQTCDRTVTKDVHSSPAVSKDNRRSAQTALPQLNTRSTGNLRQSTRLVRQRSASTDELARSPSPGSALEQGLRAPRTTTSRQIRGASRPQSVSREQGPGRLFDTMAFAISFQGRKAGESADQYKERINSSKTLEKKIRDAGGKILVSGFDELFEAHPVSSTATSPTSSSQQESEIKLLPSAVSTGFAALIADGHSRKVKYMQALALGLPCIATRWVTSCIDKGELVDWAPYLLCAGQSTFLGDAIRSRNLLPYDAAGAKLVDVVAERSRLLEGNRVLLIMKRTEESKKMAYVFLARVLGASLSRVHSVEEARARMKAAEDLDQAFDWVYVDDKMEKGDLFTGATVTPKQGTKKRKRGSAAADRGPAPKKIRTLSDEFVIQSLILGRLIEEGEMEE
ncbi:hypothetical protein GQ53DRAFT_711871 [Thozetella sp. PMI_491]|nr:hypothetical protein GQ53DRAFT_711871 [Thozetella sp. PMI_491]